MIHISINNISIHLDHITCNSECGSSLVNVLNNAPPLREARLANLFFFYLTHTAALDYGLFNINLTCIMAST